MAYPYYNELQRLVPSMTSGNFGLWYNKLIPLNDFNSCKASDARGNENNAVPYYCQQFSNTRKDAIRTALERKHRDQACYCDTFSSKYASVIVKAKLTAPLITGIGESHPHEVSLVFDHSMGIPYIPASGIKGIVRFVHTLGLLTHIPQEMIKFDKNGKAFFDDEENWTYVPQLFGTQKSRGNVFFLDAYPENVPELHVDIMNPHYGKYYSDDQNRTPPADHLDPNPIKFLTVSKGTVFIFRALVDKEKPEFVEKVKTAFVKAITEEGVGAKTAVGYGLFADLKEEEPETVIKWKQEEKEKRVREVESAKAQAEEERRVFLSEDEKVIEEIGKLEKDTTEISPLVKKCLEGSFERVVYEKLREKLEELDEWKPTGSKQKKAKMRERKVQIDAKISG